jgi:hypothetical protein
MYPAFIMRFRKHSKQAAATGLARQLVMATIDGLWYSAPVKLPFKRIAGKSAAFSLEKALARRLLAREFGEIF